MKLKDLPSFDDIFHKDLKAIIFDMDGTFLNTEYLHASTHAKISNISKEEAYSLYKGLADHLVHSAMIKNNHINITLEQFIILKNKLIIEEIQTLDHSIIKSGLMEFINKAKANNIKICLCTASEREITYALLNHLNIKNLFDLVKTNNDFKNSKPHPEPYLKTIKELNLNKDNCLIFEDSDAGIEAASRSGIPFFAVDWF